MSQIERMRTRPTFCTVRYLRNHKNHFHNRGSNLLCCFLPRAKSSINLLWKKSIVVLIKRGCAVKREGALFTIFTVLKFSESLSFRLVWTCLKDALPLQNTQDHLGINAPFDPFIGWSATSSKCKILSIPPHENHISPPLWAMHFSLLCNRALTPWRKNIQFWLVRKKCCNGCLRGNFLVLF